ncbi:hypothetical protein OCB70_13100 [Bacillus cereus]|uniref:Uncharacterized protein n=1 Tax=Bacillus cereus TaxID=1396 RepID=A0A9X7CJ82_BACCE|nr:hypothetical protein [Bacillus cereus]PEF61704.1 hypothetical protein CON35_23965 [Bacillus cereus]PFR84177.1 hypothetical protein COK42_15335 [Bacillus cereus]PGS71178.1 hypothetical protein COC69_25215 [Bacillus cereus]TKH60278.1 hypothetical protein FC680_13125 [Bacillus cereus]
MHDTKKTTRGVSLHVWSFFHYLNMSSPEFNGFFSSPTKVVKFSFELATSVGFIVFQFRYNNK